MSSQSNIVSHDSLLIVSLKYPFPSDAIIGSGGGGYSYMDVRQAPDSLPQALPVYKANRGEPPVIYLNQFSYRIFPDGHVENFDKTVNLPNENEYRRSGTLTHMWHFHKLCLPNQANLVMDTESEQYREEDGSILFTPFTQADFMFIPTKYADEFIKAAALHVKYGVFLECAYSKIVDMIVRTSDATVRNVPLCTTFLKIRDTDRFMHDCYFDGRNFGIMHPWKLITKSFSQWSSTHNWMQTKEVV